MTATLTRDECARYLAGVLGREATADETDRAYRYATVDSLFALTPDEVREARTWGIFA